MYIHSIDNDQFNQKLAFLENCNLDNATEDAVIEIVENLNKVFIDAAYMVMGVRKMTNKSKHQTNVMIQCPGVQCMPQSSCSC